MGHFRNDAARRVFNVPADTIKDGIRKGLQSRVERVVDMQAFLSKRL